MMRAMWIASGSLAVCLFTCDDAVAQGSQTSALIGTIVDATHAVLPGAGVTISSPQLIGGPQSTVADEQGSYRFASLAPGVYRMTTAHRGFRSVARADIRLAAGATVTVDVQLEVEGVSGSVNVDAASPMVDVRSAAMPTNVDDDLLQYVPIRRTLEAVVNLTPGVTAGVALGGAQGSNEFRLDGTSASEPAGGANFSAFNYNWMNEVQVVALGAGAEYGEFTGAVVNAVVRSGSNRFSGLGEYLTTRPNAADRQSNEILASWDGSAQVGGPLVNDRLWFFSGFEASKKERRPAGFMGPETTIDRAPRFITKLTSALSPRLRLEGYIEKDAPEEIGEGLGASNFRPEAFWTFHNPHTTWNARLMWTVSDRTLVEIRHGGYRGVNANEPTPPRTRSGPAPHVDSDTGLQSVNVPYYTSFAPKPVSVAAAVTHYAEGFIGRRHELKMGMEFERATALDEFGYPAGRLYYDVGGQPDTVILHDEEIVDPVSRHTSLYAQDVWTIADRVTLSPGIRLTMNRGSVPERGVVLSTNPVSPRIGVAWDVAGDHKTVVRAHAGRYHDALLHAQFEFMAPAVPPTIVAAVLGPNRFVELSRFDPANNSAIDPGITQSFVDQYVAGAERELFRDFSLEAHVVRRNFDNFMGFVDTGSIYTPVQRQDPGPDGRLGTADDGALLTVFNKTNPGREFFVFTNPDGAFRHYTAFDLVGRKRYSRNWQMLASYTWSRTVGSNNNRSGSNSGFILSDVGQRGAFADPNQAINGTGPTAFDYTHEIKLTGEYRVPFWQGIDISGIYRYRTGLAWGRVATIRGLQQGVETIRIEPRGTRRLPALNSVDLRVEKTFHPAGPNRTVGVFADIFNLNDQQIPNSDNRFAVTESSGGSFGRFGPLTDPRTIRFGARVTF